MSKFTRVILPLLALVSLSEAIGQVRQLQMSDAQIYATQGDNYAISANEFSQIGWKTVSVNRGNAVIINANCQTIQKVSSSLTAQESSLISARRSQLQSVFSGQNVQQPIRGYSSASYDIQPSGQGSKTSFAFVDENNFSITRANLPNNLARVAVYGDSVVFFTRDLQVQLKPIACLQANEQQLVQQLRAEVKQAAQQFNQQMQQSQQQFQQNMQNFNQQMQQFGQQMQQQFANPSWMPWAGFPGANSFNQGQNEYSSQYGYNQMQRPFWQQNQARPQTPNFPGANMYNVMSNQMQPNPQQSQYGAYNGAYSSPGARAGMGGAPGGMGGQGGSASGLSGWASAGTNSPLGAGFSFSL